jgi:hypothetical protein
MVASGPKNCWISVDKGQYLTWTFEENYAEKNSKRQYP